jgi:tol-pal system protein YbgF
MKRLIAAGAILLAAACSSTTATEDAPPPAASSSSSTSSAASDTQLAAIQTSLTELLERMDVMNDRIARLEEAEVVEPPAPASPVVSSPAPTVASRPAPATQPAQPPQRALIGARIAEDYRKAIMLYGRGSYGEARGAFEKVFEADPLGDLADNALFWVGETYFATRDYTNAVRYYARVMSEFADQNKAPDAMFKTGMAQARTSDLALARRTYQQLIERYPYSTAAASAKQELQRIKY